MSKGVLHGAEAVAAGGNAGRFVDEGEVLVFVHDFQGHFVSGRQVLFQVHQFDPLPGLDPVAGIAGRAVDPHFSLFDGFLDALSRRQGGEEVAGVVAQAAWRRLFGDDMLVEEMQGDLV